jgi:hypothetical protein
LRRRPFPTEVSDCKVSGKVAGETVSCSSGGSAKSQSSAC